MVALDALGDGGRQRGPDAQRDGDDVGRDRLREDGETARGVLGRGRGHALDELDALVDGQALRAVVVGEARERRVDQLDAAAVEDRSVGADGHERGPARVVGDADGGAGPRHSGRPASWNMPHDAWTSTPTRTRARTADASRTRSGGSRPCAALGGL